MASVHEKPSVPLNGIVQGADNIESLDTDPENIPYHARENALPFSYGSVPVGFHTSDLNHVGDTERMENKIDSSIYLTSQSPTVDDKVNSRTYPTSHSMTVDDNDNTSIYPTNQSMTRRSNRPSISTSCPLLRKTPTREEFDDMLMERKLQAVEAKRESAKKLIESKQIRNDFVEQPRGKQVQIVEQNVPALELCPNNFHLQFVEKKRSETPTFPTAQATLSSDRCVSPYPAPGLPNSTLISGETIEDVPYFDCTIHTKEVEPHLVKFAKDSSEYWYKPNMSREEAVDLLRNVVPGTFLIRNSTTYRNAFGLVLRVAKPPAGVVTGPGYGDELVRHFLLEPTTRGVRLMGCTNEPIFTSLSAFVYEHSINQMSLPCTLIIPDQDILFTSNNQEIISKQKQIMVQGAACNVLYLFQTDMESLTGDDAVRKAVLEMYSEYKRPIPLEVHLKISGEGITLTDNTRTQFFRRHYPAKNISHFCMDPNNHLWSVAASDEGLQRSVNKSIFAFIARPLTGSKDNQCHIFCDLSSRQPASAIVSFAHKVLPLQNSGNNMI
ncbi:tensin-1-like [Drosophila innubila]|uniref:tensin-1-like n=1 Tax=Drosophila innubila TaxID=198719 RepID=UPI00148CE70C|nr:tensin-1-like [Drosophila innubila]